ncbi:MAG: two-component system sensor kinase [Acidimicrobiales bacterium]|nr:two-component system sensor kinase [Acidimicrobiales bacterium]
MSGVAGGLAEWSGLPSMLVRVGLTFVLVGTGVGPVIYVIATAVLPVSDRGVDAADRSLVLPPKGRAREQAAVALLVAIGMSILLRAVGIWVGGGLGFPAALAAAGISLAWSRTDRERRELWRARLVRLPGDQARAEGEDSSRRRTAVVRAAAGGVLFVTGAGWVLRSAPPSTFVPVLAATVATAGGVALLAGPWIVGLWRDLSDERRARIRTEERAEVAAQLHDSVLQTLALIQRHPETTRSVAQLARHQERSLRSWLFEGNADAADAASAAPDAGTFADRLRAAIHDVEDRFDLPVELVLVGDAPADARADALVAATREAAANAARHSGSAQVAVYAEVSAASLSVFVRDRGKGFDPLLVADDRRGLRDSVVGRIERQGGTATIASAPGEGTEVALEVPR